MHVPVDAYATLRILPELGFAHELLNRRGPDDPELAEHLDKLVYYVMSRGDASMNAAKYGLWRHLQRVRHHVALLVEEAELDRLGEWAEEANAIYLLPDGSLRDPFGRVLIGEDGRSDRHARIPYPADARARRARSEAAMEMRDVHASEQLPPVVGEAELELRSTEEAARRAFALYLVARRAHALLTDAPVDLAAWEKSFPAAAGASSPAERAFLATASPERQDTIDFFWRFQALYLLLWALGGALELPFPSEPCNLPDLEAFMASVTEEQFLAHARLLPAAAILDALDLHFRCHWAVVEAQQHGQPVPGGLDGSTVRERHHALNWLVRFENAEWDDVTTPT